MPRYIDADALKEAFLIEGKDVCDGTDEFDTKWGASQELIEKVIDSAPAADVEPVRHGRWIPINRINPAWGQFGIAQHECSECGSQEVIARKRCPECGAKMQGEADDV